jgi:hypothetical protein
MRDPTTLTPDTRREIARDDYQSAAQPFLSKNSEHAFFSATFGISMSAFRGCRVSGSHPLALMCFINDARS